MWSPTDLLVEYCCSIRLDEMRSLEWHNNIHFASICSFFYFVQTLMTIHVFFFTHNRCNLIPAHDIVLYDILSLLLGLRIFPSYNAAMLQKKLLRLSMFYLWNSFKRVKYQIDTILYGVWFIGKIVLDFGLIKKIEIVCCCTIQIGKLINSLWLI